MNNNKEKEILYSGIRRMGQRLRYDGGFPQQNRMIQDKRRSFDKAVKYSYQGAMIKEVNGLTCAPALINPNKLKQDYDDKILSVGFEYDIKPGDVFEWQNTGTYWLVYLQDLTELAYFRGDIRKCTYQISFENEDGDLVNTYAAIRGPVETKINFIQKNGISVDVPNHSLNILIPKTEDTVKYFQRYSKFYLKGLVAGDDPICWRVEATDTISMPGILELTAVEYYANEMEDDIKNGIAGGLIVNPAEQEQAPSLIKGEGFIKPKISYTFVYKGNEKARWLIEGKGAPIEAKINGKEITITWTKGYSGQFVLHWGKSSKTIVVESLF